MKKSGPLVRVVCFHDVSDRAWFESIVDEMVSKYHLITPEQFHRKEFHPDKINIILTFDDGYQSWVDVAIPVLAKYNVKGIFFITSGLLDAAEEGKQAVTHFVRDRLRLKRHYQVLTWAGARKLVAAGQTIGGHTRTHASLGQLTNEVEIEREITEDKHRLESVLGVTLDDFAFPFGTKSDISPAATIFVDEAGYSHQYSGISNFALHAAGSKVIPRVLLESNQSVLSVRSWIEGNYDIFKAVTSH